MKARDTAESAALDHAAHAAMLERVERWAAVNSGSRNLVGLATMAELLADDFSALPGELELLDAAPAQTLTAEGRPSSLAHGRNLRLRVRPDAPVQVLLTGHMDTVYAADHPFQALRRRDDGSINGPGVADMKGGIAVMRAALGAIEGNPSRDRIGY